ncbi:MAG: PmoA family protein [bacterium]|nr:PmoA family protein [bacterium]
MKTAGARSAAAIALFLFMSLAEHGDAGAAEEAAKAFTLTPDEYGMVLKTPDGRTVFRYMTKKPADSELTANSVCCFYPVNTPSGERVVDFAPSDHRHHRGIFLAWHSMTGKEKADFWGWGEWAPTKDRVIQNRSVKLVESDASHAVLEVRNDWLVEERPMIHELLKVDARETKGAYVIDLDYRLTPTEDVTLDRTAFGGFCVKARKEGKGVYESPSGEVKLPDPHYLKPETDWPAADWYDYTIRLDSGKTVGIAVLDHPSNPPTTWHNLAPIAMVNPCIVAPGSVKLTRDTPLRLRYRLVIHDGPKVFELLKELSDKWQGE